MNIRLVQSNRHPAVVPYLVERLGDHVDARAVFLHAQIGPQIDDQEGQWENPQCVYGHVEQVSFHTVRVPAWHEKQKC